MKLRNRDTKQVKNVKFYTSDVEEKDEEGKFHVSTSDGLVLYDGKYHYAYETLKQLNNEWEDL